MIALILLLLQEDVRRIDKPEQCIECHQDAPDEMKGSVHAKETCVGCHGIDEINPRKTSGNPHWKRPTFKSWRGRNLTEDCAACHTGIMDALKGSGHNVDTRKPASSMKKGCLDCHFADDPTLTPGGRAHGIPKASRGVILNTCRSCHQPNTNEFQKGRLLFESMDLFDARTADIEIVARSVAGKPGISPRPLNSAVADAKRTSAQLAVAQHGLKFADLEALRAASAGPLEAAYNSQSQKEREFAGRWVALAPFLVFIAASLAFVHLTARAATKGAA
jgi:nitrate/TMAO reductase-like tetraheme cytochrome c subunit